MDLCKSALCTGCAACVNACPKQCIQMVADVEGFLRPVVDTSQCVACGTCQNVCPILHSQSCDNQTFAYAAIHKDEKIRMKSTSGGAFSLLCQWIFDHGGVVFGVAYADDFSMEHRCVHSMEELSALRSAKYAQSRIGDSFQQVKQFLEKGQYVLFSGTPCQVGGLHTFLRKPYERLILVDLICHGVPSPAVWQQYIHYRSQKDAAGDAPVSINLRSKETGWPGYSIRFDYSNGVHYSSPNSKDPFLRCFVGDLCLRPSCYQCQFKGMSRCSDFTLGDYWGIWNQLPEYNDGKGTSLVLIHSQKAMKLWEHVSPQVQCTEVDISKSIVENPSALSSSPLPASRTYFMKCYSKADFQALVDKLLPKPAKRNTPFVLLRRIAHKLRRMTWQKTYYKNLR